MTLVLSLRARLSGNEDKTIQKASQEFLQVADKSSCRPRRKTYQLSYVLTRSALTWVDRERACPA